MSTYFTSLLFRAGSLPVVWLPLLQTLGRTRRTPAVQPISRHPPAHPPSTSTRSSPSPTQLKALLCHTPAPSTGRAILSWQFSGDLGRQRTFFFDSIIIQSSPSVSIGQSTTSKALEALPRRPSKKNCKWSSHSSSLCSVVQNPLFLAVGYVAASCCRSWVFLAETTNNIRSSCSHNPDILGLSLIVLALWCTDID